MTWKRIDRVENQGPIAVIGDVHGESGLLKALLRQLDREHPDGRMPVVVVGDVCDRGPDTAGVIDQLVLRRASGVRGNHEEWLCRYAAGEGFDDIALSKMVSGRATLLSYGIEVDSRSAIEDSWRTIPRAHRTWLASLPAALRLVVDGIPFYVVHAGVKASLMPELPAAFRLEGIVAGAAEDLLWATLTEAEMAVLDAPVIHGHRPVAMPVDAGHAIAIDTGAGTFGDGRLTAVILPERRFITVTAADIYDDGVDES
jgi:serine/threonine protein phosphatase 1